MIYKEYFWFWTVCLCTLVAGKSQLVQKHPTAFRAAANHKILSEISHPVVPKWYFKRKTFFHQHFCSMWLRTSCMSEDLKICRLHLVLTRTQRTLIKQWRVQNTSATTWGVLPYWKIKLMQQCFLFSCLPLLFLRTACSSGLPPVPTILSALYGYDGCIGGVNNFATEEEYLRELKRFVFVPLWIK